MQQHCASTKMWNVHLAYNDDDDDDNNPPKKHHKKLTIRGWFNKNKAGRSKLFWLHFWSHIFLWNLLWWHICRLCHLFLNILLPPRASFFFFFFCRGWSENIIPSPLVNRFGRTPLSASAIFFFLVVKKCTSSTRTRSESGETSYRSQQQRKAFMRAVYSFYVSVRTVLSGVTSN